MSIELLTTDFTKNSGSGTFSKIADGLKLENFLWIYTPFITLPTGSNITYEYDFICSIDAGDCVYIQVERFDSSKGTISNNAATNCIGGVQPSSKLNYERYKGTIALATFNTNTPTAFIKLRIGNAYNNTSGTMIVHSWSLKVVYNNSHQQQQIFKNGQLITETFRERTGIATFSKNGFIDSPEFYEY